MQIDARTISLELVLCKLIKLVEKVEFDRLSEISTIERRNLWSH